VISVPLSQFAQSPNFYGFGHVNIPATGKSAMPSPSKTGLAQPPQSTTPTSIPPTATDPNSYLANVLSQRSNGNSNLPFYTPFEPVQHSEANTLYDPNLSPLLTQYGIDIPQTYNWTTPSLADQRNQLEQQPAPAAPPVLHRLVSILRPLNGHKLVSYQVLWLAPRGGVETTFSQVLDRRLKFLRKYRGETKPRQTALVPGFVASMWAAEVSGTGRTAILVFYREITTEKQYWNTSLVWRVSPIKDRP
jgi:hypothetical protein